MAKTLQHQIIERALDVLSEEKHGTRCSMGRNIDGDACSVWLRPTVSARWVRCGALPMN